MNPPFRLGPVNPASPDYSANTLSPHSYNRLELSLGAAFVPGDGIDSQLQLSWRYHPHLFMRSGIGGNFQDRFHAQFQAGVRIPFSDMFSLEPAVSTGIGVLVNQERQQGRFAENIIRDGLSITVGGEVRFNIDLSESLGLFLSATYQREFCGSVMVTPTRLPFTQNRVLCEDENLIGFGGGIRFGFSRTTQVLREDDREDRRDYNPASIEETVPEPIQEESFEDRVGYEIAEYISDFTALTGERIRSQIEYVARHSHFYTLPRSLQKMVIMKAIQGENTDDLISLSTQLFEIDQRTTSVRSYESIEWAVNQILNASGIRLHPETLASLRRLRTTDRQHQESFELAYEYARLHLQSAMLHYVMNPYARRAVREYIEGFAREQHVSLRSLDDYSAPVITLGRHDLDVACHMDGVGGCANPSSPLSTQALRVDLERDTPDRAYEVTFHENMHLFSAITRQQLGCRSYDYNLRGISYLFPFWMEEALNEINIHAGLRSLNRDRQYTLEANTDGRLAIEHTIQHEGEALSASWRSMHLFCRADNVERSLGAAFFRRLTTGHTPHDVYGAEFLRRVDRYYDAN